MTKKNKSITNKLYKFLSLFFCLLLTTSVFLDISLDATAHPGYTDENGFHYQNGRRHCH